MAWLRHTGYRSYVKDPRAANHLSRTALAMMALAAAACAPAPSPTPVAPDAAAGAAQARLSATGGLVHDGGIVFAKNYPAPRLENSRLVPIFGADDPTSTRRMIALTNGVKAGLLPTAPQAEVALGKSGFGILAVMLGERKVGTGAGSPDLEARYALAAAGQEKDVPFFVARPDAQGRLAVPDTVDLRGEMPAVRDQGRRNMGVAFATAAMLDYLAQHDPALPIKHASPQFLNWRYQTQIKSKLTGERDRVWSARDTYPTLFFSLLHLDGNPTPTEGSPYVPPLQGYVSEETCPYQTDLAVLPPDTNILEAAKLNLGEALAGQVVDHALLNSQGAYFYRLKADASTYEAALAGGQPVQLSLPVYTPDWRGPTAANRYHVADLDSSKINDAQNLAYQAVVVVGYEKDPTAPGGGWFLVRNSWGTTWGEAGHARVSFRTVLDYGYAAHVAVAYAKPFDGHYDVFPPPDGPSQDPNWAVALPPVGETSSWGVYSDATRQKEGDQIQAVPTPPVPLTAAGLPAEQGHEADAYTDDKFDLGEYHGRESGIEGAYEPIDDPVTPAPEVP
ncbi:MAG: peptidase papain [Cyanobacteria bacterium RYN_339]|nr:peptidase papain [Cyanobacteria bacterium RYN_339]